MKVRLLSINPVKFKKWYIKASSTNFDTICLIFFNMRTHDVVVRFFSDEIEANIFTEKFMADSESSSSSDSI